MHRGNLFLCVALLPAVLLGLSHQEAASGNNRNIKNVIVIGVDTLSARNLHFMGYDRRTTPFLDELAENSVVFENTYSPKSITQPSFASLFTGMHPVEHGIIENGWKIPDSLHFLTEDFQSKGFRTWGIPASQVIGGKFGMGKGFDYYANVSPVPQDAYKIIARVNRLLNNNPMLGEPSFDESSKPLFMFIHFYDPHTEYTPNQDYLDEYRDYDYPGAVDGTWETYEKFNSGEYASKEIDVRYTWDLYDAEIRTFDDKARELFALFDETGLLQNSLIVFTADHGESLGEHGFFTHGYPYEGSLHIPLIMHFPGDEFGGLRISQAVSNMDILPTVTDILGFNAREGIQGHSLYPLLDESTSGSYTPWNELLALGRNTPEGEKTYSIYNGVYRLIVEGEDLSLYDVVHDPDEAVNIAELHKGVVVDLNRKALSILAAGRNSNEQQVDEQTLVMLSSLGYLH
jgi:arylsulfatase A-like enzyme